MADSPRKHRRSWHWLLTAISGCPRPACPKLSRTAQGSLRVGLGVLCAASIGFACFRPLGGPSALFANYFSNACMWAGITIILVAQPVLGRTNRSSLERILGTVLGAGVALAAWYASHSAIVLGIVSFPVPLVGTYVGKRLDLEYSFKLFTLTYLIVSFGALSGVAAWQYALSRVIGISTGVLTLLTTSVLIYPHTASDEAVSSLHDALVALCDLNKHAWDSMAIQREPTAHEHAVNIPSNVNTSSSHKAEGTSARACDDGVNGVLHVTPQHVTSQAVAESVAADERVAVDADATTAALQQSAAAIDVEQQLAQNDTKCETSFLTVYSSLAAVKEHVKHSRGEYLFWRLGQRPVFLPRLPFAPRGESHHMPEQDIRLLDVTMRHVARLVWNIHVTFQQGFDHKMLQVLQQQYPAQLINDLRRSAAAVFQSMAAAFPTTLYDHTLPKLSAEPLDKFLQHVEMLLCISAKQRRAAVHRAKTFRIAKSSAPMVLDADRMPHPPSAPNLRHLSEPVTSSPHAAVGPHNPHHGPEQWFSAHTNAKSFTTAMRGDVSGAAQNSIGGVDGGLQHAGMQRGAAHHTTLQPAQTLLSAVATTPHDSAQISHRRLHATGRTPDHAAPHSNIDQHQQHNQQGDVRICVQRSSSSQTTDTAVHTPHATSSTDRQPSHDQHIAKTEGSAVSDTQSDAVHAAPAACDGVEVAGAMQNIESMSRAAVQLKQPSADLPRRSGFWKRIWEGLERPEMRSVASFGAVYGGTRLSSTMLSERAARTAAAERHVSTFGRAALTLVLEQALNEHPSTSDHAVEEQAWDLVFDNTTEGYIWRIRWVAFQFLIQQLAEELCALHLALSTVMSKLPH